MKLPPLSVIASWPAPNYTHPATRGPANLTVNLLFFLLACCIVCIRLVARLKISKTFGWDDALIVAAMFPTTAFAILSLLTTIKFAWNRHIWDVPHNLIIIGLKLSVVSQILFTVSTSLTKLSMLALTYRIVHHGTTNFWKYLIAAMVLICLQSVAFTMVVLFQCGSPNKYWTLTFADQGCISDTKHLLAAGIINTVTDIIVVVLPMSMVYRLHLPFRQQVAIATLFGVGILVTLAGGVRTIYLYRVTSEWDKTWLAYPVYICSSVELYIGIICASIPATNKFFSYLWPKIWGSKLMSGSFRSRSTQATAVNSTSGTTVMDSVAVGQYDNDQNAIPLHEYQVEIPTSSFSPKTHQMRHSISVFPSSSADRARTPDSKAETIYEISKAESHEGLILHNPLTPISPMVPARPAPSYRQSR